MYLGFKKYCNEMSQLKIYAVSCLALSREGANVNLSLVLLKRRPTVAKYTRRTLQKSDIPKIVLSDDNLIHNEGD